MQEEFVVCVLSRDDLKEIGLNPDSLSDSAMKKIASKMGESYCNNGFWEDLRFYTGVFEETRIDKNE